MRIFAILAFAFGLLSCGSNKNETATVESQAPDSTGNYFPVTTFLLGEIRDVRDHGMAPVRKKAGAKDSAFLKPEEFEAAFAAFVTPVIDSANLKSSFSEAKFKDETLNAFTFSYDPLPGKNNDFPFTHWDVYVDPNKGTVRRLYLVKEAEGRILQLTWTTGKKAKILEMEEKNGKPVVIRDETISWSYD